MQTWRYIHLTRLLSKCTCCRRKKQADLAQQGPGPLSGLRMGNSLIPLAHPDRLTFSEFAYALPATTQSSKRPRPAAREQRHMASERQLAVWLDGAAAWEQGINAGLEQLSAFDPAPSHTQPVEPDLDGATADDYGYDAGVCCSQQPRCCIFVPGWSTVIIFATNARLLMTDHLRLA